MNNPVLPTVLLILTSLFCYSQSYNYDGRSIIYDQQNLVGIGTNSPTAKLHIKRSGTMGGKYAVSASVVRIGDGDIDLLMDGNEIYSNHALVLGSSYSKDMLFRNVSSSSHENLMVLKSSGNLGIGTSNPVQILHVSSSTSGDAILRLEADTDNNKEKDNARIEMYQDGGLIYAYLGFNEDTNTNFNMFQFSMGSPDGFQKSALTINPYNGNIGMGLMNPTDKLEVNGTIRSREVKVEATSWPDYVFQEDYVLKPLDKLEQYIAEHQHLPEIPSAAEIEENGLELGEMNKLLLKKIEELTLIIIDQEKRLKKLENQKQ